jgi:hypothetical protein
MNLLRKLGREVGLDLQSGQVDRLEVGLNRLVVVSIGLEVAELRQGVVGHRLNRKIEEMGEFEIMRGLGHY